MQKKNLCYKSDFKITEKCDAGYAMRFRFLYYVGSPSKAYVASYDGVTYTNCHLNEDGTLTVSFDNHGLGIGDLMVERRYYFDDEQFQSGVCDVVVPAAAVIVIDKDAPTVSKLFQLVLSTVGLSYIECISVVEPYWMYGGFGDSAYANEEARKLAEANRVIAEQKRESDWTTWFTDTKAKFTAWFNGTKTEVSSWLDAAKSEVSTWLNESKAEVSSWFTSTKNEVATWFTSTKNEVKAWFDTAKNDAAKWLSDTKSAWTAWFNQTSAMWTSWFDGIKNTWTTWFNTINTIWDDWFADIKVVWSNWFNPVKVAWETFKTSADTWISDAKSAWATWFGDTKSTWTTWYNSTVSAWDKWFDATKSAWDKWFADTKSAWTSWLDGAKAEWTALKNNVTSAIADVNTAKTATETATDNANAAAARCETAKAAADKATADAISAKDIALSAAGTAKVEAQAAKTIATDASNINNQSKVLISEMNDGLEAQKTATANAETAAASARAAAELASKAGTSIMIRPTGMSVDVPKVVPVGATAIVEVSMSPESCYASKVFQSKKGCFVAPDGSAEFTEIGTAVFYVVPTLNDTIAKKVEVTVRALESLQAEDGTEITMEDGSTFEI